MKRRSFLLVCLLLLLAGSVPSLTDAQTNTSRPERGFLADGIRLLPNCASSGNCGFNDFLLLFANLARWGFAILGTLALLYMIWGGAHLLISGGRRDYITKGKDAIKGAFLGTLMVLLAVVIVQFVDSAIRQKPVPDSSSVAACRTTYPTQYRDAVCSGNDIGFGCADPGRGPGTVTRVQQLLERVCTACGPIDGCFGPDTANCLWQFLSANRAVVPPYDLREDPVNGVRTDASVMALLQDPNANPCYFSEEEPIILEPTIDPGDNSAQSIGCCVPGNTDHSCFSTTQNLAVCPVDIPNEPPEQQPQYEHRPRTQCADVPQCNSGCCFKFESDGSLTCANNCTPSGCTGHFLQGSCSGYDFFNRCDFSTPGDVCSETS